MPLERWVLPNGLIVLYQENRSIPLAAGTLLLRTGSYEEAPGEAGLVNLAVELWLQGTRRRSARRMADAVESIGASLGAQASEDHIDVNFVAPAAHWTQVLEVVADILSNASFPSEEIVKERAHVLASLASRHDTIFTVAHDHLNTALYGPRHPYGRPVEGFLKTVQRFTRQDLLTWHRSHIRPNQGIFSIVAPFPLRKAAAMIERYFGGWKYMKSDPALMRPRPNAPMQDLTLGNKRVRVQAPFQQAYLMTGIAAPSALDPDYLTLKILNIVLGGGMSSRLFLRLREDLGLAYEVASFFPSRLRASQWVIYLGLPVEKLKTAEKKLHGLLLQLHHKGVSSAEIKQAKQLIKGSYVMEHQTRRRQAWYAAWWEFLGKGPGFDVLFPKAVDAVTLPAVQSLARRLLSQPRATIEVIPK